MSTPGAVPETVIRLEQLADGCARFSQEFMRTQGTVPLPGSPAAAEFEDPVYGAHAADGNNLGLFQLVAAQDYLGSLGALVRAEFSVYALAVLARATLEASARAWWLLDPEISRAIRTERTLTERLYSLLEHRKVMALLLSQAKDQEEMSSVLTAAIAHDDVRMKGIVDEGKALGLKGVPDRKGRIVGFGRQRAPSTEVVGKVVKAAGLPWGEEVFHLYSGTAHVTASALFNNLEVIDDVPPDVKVTEDTRVGAIRMTVGQLQLDIGIPVHTWLTAFGAAVQQMGWAQDEWQPWRMHALKTLARIVKQR